MEVRKVAADPGGGEPSRFRWGFPGQAKVGGEGAGKAELGERGDDDPGPAVGRFGVADLRNGPAQGLLEEPEGVLDVEAAQPCRPDRIEQVGMRYPRFSGQRFAWICETSSLCCGNVVGDRLL